MSKLTKRLQKDRSSWDLNYEDLRKTRLAQLSETLHSLRRALHDPLAPRSYGLSLSHKDQKMGTHEDQLIQSFVQNFVDYKNLDYIPLDQKEAFMVQIQKGVQDGIISEALYSEMVQAIEFLYRKQTILENFVYSNLRSPQDNGASLAVVLIEFERANEYFNTVVDKFLDYAKYAPEDCASQDPCIAPCVQNQGECRYPYSEDDYSFYWGTRLDL